jgi:hypothetical protein
MIGRDRDCREARRTLWRGKDFAILRFGRFGFSGADDAMPSVVEL